MLKYIYRGISYDKLPDPLDTGEFMISPMTEERFLQFGGEMKDDGKLSNFQICCAKFRQVVFDIREFIHDPTFMGGFDEIHKLEESPYALADRTTANTLSNRWTGANLAATYEGGKIGLGQPAWFYKCWEEWAQIQAAKAAQQQIAQNPYDNPYEDDVIEVEAVEVVTPPAIEAPVEEEEQNPYEEPIETIDVGDVFYNNDFDNPYMDYGSITGTEIE